MTEDGGYYAIKGFVYQFDKSIIEILKNPNKKIQIEQEQDVNFENFIVQVKYYESNYNRSQIKQKIKDTTYKLLKQFESNKCNKYCLYTHFKNEVPRTVKYSVNELNDLLGNKKEDFTSNIKRDFVESFILVYAKNFKDQFLECINEIMNSYDVTYEIAQTYHPIIFEQLLNIVTENPKENKVRRVANKELIDERIQYNKSLIFRKTYADFLGKERYLRTLRKNYFTYRNISPYERIFLLSVSPDNKISDIKDIVLRISQKWGKNTERTHQPYVPYIYLMGISNPDLVRVKKELQSEGLNFRDGFDYFGSEYNAETITILPNSKNMLHLKFINRLEHIEKTIPRMKRTVEVYQFFKKEPIAFNVDIKHVKIQIDDLEDVSKIV